MAESFPVKNNTHAYTTNKSRKPSSAERAHSNLDPDKFCRLCLFFCSCQGELILLKSDTHTRARKDQFHLVSNGEFLSQSLCALIYFRVSTKGLLFGYFSILLILTLTVPGIGSLFLHLFFALVREAEGC